MEYRPWIDFKKDIEILDIEAPPCKDCDFWRPHRRYVGTRFDGVTLCARRDLSRGNGGMEEDFSCYRPKDGSTTTEGE